MSLTEQMIWTRAPRRYTVDEGRVTKAPTRFAPGERTFTCTRCDQTRTQPIGKLAVDTAPLEAAIREAEAVEEDEYTDQSVKE